MLRINILRRGSIVTFMRARKAQQAERGVIEAIKERYVAQETNVKWDGFEPVQKTATEVNDETAYGSKNRPDFDQTLFDSDFRFVKNLNTSVITIWFK